MELIKVINEYWQVIVGFTALVVWLVRLEGKHAQNEKDISRNESRLTMLEVKHIDLDSKLVQKLSSVRESLARIEGALGLNIERKDK